MLSEDKPISTYQAIKRINKFWQIHYRFQEVDSNERLPQSHPKKKKKSDVSIDFEDSSS